MIFHRLRQLLFPRGLYCALCKTECMETQYICSACQAQILWQPHQRSLPGLDALHIAGYYHSQQRTLIHRFKYDGERHLGSYLAMQLQALGDCRAFLLLPVPSHPKRRRERGFSQTEDLARCLAQQNRAKLARHALQRTRNTPSQARLNAQERRSNVKNAFAARPEHVRGQHILLIEDIVSTGSTLQSCAAALRQAGAQSVTAWALAEAGHPNR